MTRANPSPTEQPDPAQALDAVDVRGEIDLRFAVPFTHRLRFTTDVLAPPDDRVLVDVLHADRDEPARVLAVVERGVDDATGVGRRLREMQARHPRRMAVVDLVHLAGGERVKNDVRRLLPVLQGVLDGVIDRRSYVLAVGGGAFLDAVGFAAALAHRGVRLVRMPTTTLSQADSGVGVKNAINFFGKKNWLGTFAVPWAVINDRTLLQTLPDRDWR